MKPNIIEPKERFNLTLSPKPVSIRKALCKQNHVSFSSFIECLLIEANKKEAKNLEGKLQEANELIELGTKMKEEVELENMTINKDKQVDLKVAINKFLVVNTRSGYRVFRKTNEIKMAIDELSYRFGLPREQVHGYMVEAVKEFFQDPDERLLMMRRLQELEGKYAL